MDDYPTSQAPRSSGHFLSKNSGFGPQLGSKFFEITSMSLNVGILSQSTKRRGGFGWQVALCFWGRTFMSSNSRRASIWGKNGQKVWISLTLHVGQLHLRSRGNKSSTWDFYTHCLGPKTPIMFWENLLENRSIWICRDAALIYIARALQSSRWS